MPFSITNSFTVMQEKNIYLKLEKYLTILDSQIKIRTLDQNDIIQSVNIVDQSIETIKNYCLTHSNKLLIDDWMYLVKALKHYFEIKRSVDARIEMNPNLTNLLLSEIVKINNYIKNFTNGTI